MMSTLVIDTMSRHREAAGMFFEELAEHAARFHPHPLTREFALLHRWDRDVYVVMMLDTAALAYGILRGWDAGFDVPSLGIAVGAAVRGRGLGRMMMEYLHCVARLRDAKAVRLKVYPDNVRALRLYESLGYQWKPDLEAEQLVGLRTL